LERCFAKSTKGSEGVLISTFLKQPSW
jgi:hypothetical protein